MVQLHCNPLKEAHISTIGQSKVKLGKLDKRLIEPIKEFIEDDMASYAAALSFWVFFSLFPFILFLVALLSFLGIPGFFDWLVEQAQTVIVLYVAQNERCPGELGGEKRARRGPLV